MGKKVFRYKHAPTLYYFSFSYRFAAFISPLLLSEFVAEALMGGGRGTLSPGSFTGRDMSVRGLSESRLAPAIKFCGVIACHNRFVGVPHSNLLRKSG
ncbi:hypothetical protein CEXT_188761 [Caerostris extrusa]|uniref:Uncharacterized protein n=1 Tax=Caerostris extrusa TaxID=172846 RepID=A0AAV4NMN5_CAEEX|nr:hypothetical protein CEXT_188761 [Caerostris extrusa]